MCNYDSPSVLALLGSLIFAAVFFLSTPLRAEPLLNPDENPTPLLPSIDLRPNFEKWHLTPRVQGGRDTCSVFVITCALEYALADQTGSTPRLSVEFLNWASNETLGISRDGAFFHDLYTGYQKFGICPETDLPYQTKYDPDRKPPLAALDSAQKILQQNFKFLWIKDWNRNTGLTDDQFLKIKQILNRNRPVCGGFRWPTQEAWKDNVLQMAPPEGVFDGHSVLLVGYQDDPAQPGGGLFLFRNTNYGGRDGYMPYEYARAYMNDAVWIDYPKNDNPKNNTSLSSSLTEILGPLGFFPQGRNRRVSSNQQPDWHSENLDMTWLMPGESVNMPVLEGPGVITHIWFTSHAGWVGELNALTLRIYYDNDPQPGVEVPVGDFFAVGHGQPAVVNSIPVQVSPTGSLTCYWRMPFRQSARIVVTNDNPDRSTGLYWQVDWMQLPDLSPDIPYFYARYRQEYPAVPGRDYLLADLQGSGYYVGTVLSVTLAQNGWFGEGDDFFYIDGETVPSLQGTGSEDYFNDAWGFRPRASLWFGQPRWQDYSAGDGGAAYRWHYLDPVHFSQSLQVAIEHMGNLDDAIEGFFLERPDFLSSVAFWYQTGQPKDSFPPLPDWYSRRVPWQHHHLVKTYLQAKTSDDSKVTVQAQGFFGARPILLWPSPKPAALLTLPFQLTEDGTFAVRLTAANGPNYGSFDIELDGQKVAAADFRKPTTEESEEADLPLGTHDLKTGDHTIAFRAAADKEHTGDLGVEILRLLKLPAPAARAEKTHHEAHFIRLGIGRAVYAYRLAYGTLPDSLETLVQTGFMPERYLRDENNLPLQCTRQEDKIIVESTGKDHWTHSWQGLDPRR